MEKKTASTKKTNMNTRSSTQKLPKRTAFFASLLAVISLAGAAFGLSSFFLRDKVLYYDAGKVQKELSIQILKGVYEHVELMYMEYTRLIEDIKKLEQGAKSNNALQGKLNARQRELKNLESKMQVAVNTAQNTLAKQYLKERFPKALETVMKNRGCSSIVPLGGEFFLNDPVHVLQAMGSHGTYAIYIDPNKDCTDDILKEMGVDVKNQTKDEENTSSINPGEEGA